MSILDILLSMIVCATFHVLEQVAALLCGEVGRPLHTPHASAPPKSASSRKWQGQKSSATAAMCRRLQTSGTLLFRVFNCIACIDETLPLQEHVFRGRRERRHKWLLLLWVRACRRRQCGFRCFGWKALCNRVDSRQRLNRPSSCAQHPNDGLLHCYTSITFCEPPICSNAQPPFCSCICNSAIRLNASAAVMWAWG